MNAFPDCDSVCQILLDAAAHRRPPTDLQRVCALWPNLKIVEENIEQAGYLVPIGVLGADILVRRDDSITRKRFTAAHEIGHWALSHFKDGELSFANAPVRPIHLRVDHRRNNPEEIWCNKFAACLLMPAHDLSHYLSNVKAMNKAQHIRQGGLAFQVSFEAFVRRVTDTTCISVFEVVGDESGRRVHRRFLSNLQASLKLLNAMEGFLQYVAESGGSLSEQVTIDDHVFVTALTRHSRYGKSWLVVAEPVARDALRPMSAPHAATAPAHHHPR